MYKKVLHATDLKENHFDLCQKAHHIAQEIGASFHLLHVVSPPNSLQWAQSLGFAEFDRPIPDQAEAVLKVVADGLNLPHENLHVQVGSIKQTILTMIKELDCDLLIIGSDTPEGVQTLLGSTANALIHYAPIDVLTLRS
ncbi:universal stress protein [Legionella sp. W05-934-2]|jgi:universal stress protein A|uniref:universal stress protein n=1 Tax=Legionella sp. W05-934-2 TaxID=1198649 RepID=UPI0034637622